MIPFTGDTWNAFQVLAQLKFRCTFTFWMQYLARNCIINGLIFSNEDYSKGNGVYLISSSTHEMFSSGVASLALNYENSQMNGEYKVKNIIICMRHILTKTYS